MRTPNRLISESEQLVDNVAGRPDPPPENPVPLEPSADLVDLLMWVDPRPLAQLCVRLRTMEAELGDDPLGVRHRTVGSHPAGTEESDLITVLDHTVEL